MAAQHHPGIGLPSTKPGWFGLFPDVKQHKSLKGLSPAMAAGISPTLWSMTDLAEMIDASLPKPGPRGPYEKRMVV
jgi:hypothetical protein